jgi:hypothetical protein
VEADFAVELGAKDETLELPWAADDGGPRYYDLKRQPEFLLDIEEAGRAPELAEFLAVRLARRNSRKPRSVTPGEHRDQSRREIWGRAIRVLR